MASYTLYDDGMTPPVARGTLTATFDHKDKKLTDVTYKNTGDYDAGIIGDIPLTGPDANGNYTGDHRLGGGLTVTDHGPHKHMTFTFNPAPPANTPQFSNGRFDDKPADDDGFSWSASSDGLGGS